MHAYTRAARTSVYIRTYICTRVRPTICTCVRIYICTMLVCICLLVFVHLLVRRFVDPAKRKFVLPLSPQSWPAAWLPSDSSAHTSSETSLKRQLRANINRLTSYIPHIHLLNTSTLKLRHRLILLDTLRIDAGDYTPQRPTSGKSGVSRVNPSDADRRSVASKMSKMRPDDALK